MKFARLLAAKNDDILNAPPVTAAFLGDSVTHGCFECYRDEDGNIQTIFEREQSYAAKFAHIAGMLYPRAQLNIVNAGVSGGTAMQAAARLERDVLHFRPDLLVVNFALNDCGAGDRGLEEYVASMKKIFRQGKEAGAEVVYLTPNPMCGYVSAHLNSDFCVRSQKIWPLARRTAFSTDTWLPRRQRRKRNAFRLRLLFGLEKYAEKRRGYHSTSGELSQPSDKGYAMVGSAQTG